MAIRELNENLNNVGALADQPTEQASELKAIFDKAGNQIKTYINSVLIPDMVQEFLSKAGGTISQNLTINGNLVNDAETTLKRLIVNQLATFGGGVAINSSGTNNGLEIYGSTPFIDYHFNNTSSDYTIRIIEDTLKHLQIIAENGLNFSFNPNALSFGDGDYASSDYWFVKNAHNGHHIVNTWQDSGKLELSIDNVSQGYFTMTTTSDQRLKDNIQPINEAVINAIGEVALKQFNLKRNNKNNKISFGVIAQELIEIFKKYNLDVNDYNLIDTVIYEDGIEYFIVNYEQFQILRLAYIENKLGG